MKNLSNHHLTTSRLNSINLDSKLVDNKARRPKSFFSLKISSIRASSHILLSSETTHSKADNNSHLEIPKLSIKNSFSQKNLELISEYKKQISEILSKEFAQNTKKAKSSEVLPMAVNNLRKESQYEVILNQRLSQYKKQLFINRCLSNRKNLVDTGLEIVADKADLRRKFLKELQSKITNEIVSPISYKAENSNELKTAENFFKYVEWLSGEGKKKYEIQPFSNKKVQKSVNAKRLPLEKLNF